MTAGTPSPPVRPSPAPAGDPARAALGRGRAGGPHGGSLRPGGVHGGDRHGSLRRLAVVRRLAVLQRAVRREARAMLTWRRLVAIALLALAGGIGLAGMWARGELGGGDARAYWGAVRIWLNGGDPYHPTGPFMPYVYSPWLLPFFLPWALLPMDVAWFAWRGSAIVGLLWTVGWAYRRRPLATAVVAFVLAFPMFANLDTGNINVQMILFLWGAQFAGPRLAGLLWALAAAMKWVPLVFLPLLAPRARLHGIVMLAVAALLTIVTLPLTLVQLQVLFAIARPPRFDYVAYAWALVPWFWRQPDPARIARPATWRRWAAQAAAAVGATRQGQPSSPVAAVRSRVVALRQRSLQYFGIAPNGDSDGPADER